MCLEKVLVGWPVGERVGGFAGPSQKEVNSAELELSNDKAGFILLFLLYANPSIQEGLNFVTFVYHILQRDIRHGYNLSYVATHVKINHTSCTCQHCCVRFLGIKKTNLIMGKKTPRDSLIEVLTQHLWELKWQKWLLVVYPKFRTVM